MKSLRLLLVPLSLLLLLAAMGCPPSMDDDDTTVADDDDSGAVEAAWWPSCGDPVCSGWTPSGYPLCAGPLPGQGCSNVGDVCDPQSGCNELLYCDTSNPFPGPCPISWRAAKTDISALTAADRRAVLDQVMGLELARYRYRDGVSPEGKDKERLGILLDDVGDIPALRGDRLDLYAFTSMAIAGLQAQQAEIDALRYEIELLRAERDRCAAP